MQTLRWKEVRVVDCPMNRQYPYCVKATDPTHGKVDILGHFRTLKAAERRAEEVRKEKQACQKTDQQ